MLLLEDRRFYVYVYCDPRKPGNYNYGEFHFDYEPFYVGKGKYRRLYDHLGEAKNLKTHSHKVNKIRKIWFAGLNPIIIKIKDNLTNFESLTLEELLGSLIKLIQDGGTLTNAKYPNAISGGHGSISLETRNEISKSVKKFLELNPNYYSSHITYKKGEQNPLFGTIKTEKEKENISNTLKLYYENLKKCNKFDEFLLKRKASSPKGKECYQYVNIDEDQIIDLYFKGFTALNISKILDAPYNALKNRIKELGLYNGYKKVERLNFLKNNYEIYNQCYPEEGLDRIKNHKIERKLFGNMCFNTFNYEFKFLIDMYFNKKTTPQICDEYYITFKVTLSRYVFKNFLNILDFPIIGTGSCFRKEYLSFISENEHKKQWYIDNYKRLEQEYFDKKFAERHPEFVENIS